MGSEALHLSHHHVIHKIWGIHFLWLACILPTSKTLHLLKKFLIRMVSKAAASRNACSAPPSGSHKEKKFSALNDIHAKKILDVPRAFKIKGTDLILGISSISSASLYPIMDLPIM